MQFIIVGAGGFGREVANWVGLDNVAGFLDDTMEPGFSPKGGQVMVLGGIDRWHEFTMRGARACLIAIGDPDGREKVVERMDGAWMPAWRHPTSFVADTAKIGDGCLIGPFTNIAADCKLGRFVIVNGHSGVGHDAEVGDFCTLSSHVDITGRVVVGRKCFFGSRAGAIPGVNIGEQCVIGAGAIAVRTVPPFGTLYENPPRYLAR